MKAAIALIFFACFAGSMANPLVEGLVGQGQAIISAVVTNLHSQIQNIITGALGQLTGVLGGIIGGTARLDLSGIFGDFLSQIQGAVTGIGQRLLNQGLAAVLGGLGGSRGIGDFLAGISQQIGAVVSGAQGAISGALGGLVDASKPPWEQLQEQLVGHGLNVLGSLSETINNLHGSITGGR